MAKDLPAVAENVPPHNLQAEIAILGDMLLDPQATDIGLDVLRPKDFYRTAHQLIFSAARKVIELGFKVDMVTVAEQLEREGHLDEIGGAVYLTDIAERIASTASAPYHAKIVKEHSVARQAIINLTEVINRAYEDPKDVLEKAQKAIFDIALSDDDKDFEQITKTLQKAYEVLDSCHNLGEGFWGVKTGLNQLDQMTMGFQNGDLVLLAGRPSSGKTSMALNMMRYCAVEQGVPVGMFSIEMTDTQLAMRMLSTDAGVNLRKAKAGKMNAVEWQNMAQATGKLADAPIYINDVASPTLFKIRSKAQRLKAERQIGLLVIDYLQLIQPVGRFENENAEVAAISKGLKALAKDLDLPVVALSQLNRECEKRADKRPMLSDLRSSGTLEQDADTVMFTYRPSMYRGLEGSDEIIVAKQRNGPTGFVNVKYREELTSWENLDTVHEDIEEEEVGF